MNLPRSLTLTLCAAALLPAAAARAGILQDFRFGDADGTVITAAANSAAPTNLFQSQNTAVESAVNNGSFRIQKSSVTGQVGNTFDIDNVTSGKVWLVAKIAGWNYSAIGSSLPERVRFGFLDNNDPVGAGSSTIAAEMTIDRLADNSLVLSGEALGTGFTPVATDLPLALVRSTPLKIALELDKDADQYSVYYMDNGGPRQLLGTGELGASTLNLGDRDGNSVRFAFTGTFGEPGEFFDLDRLYLTDDISQIPEPASAALLGIALAAFAGSRRRA